MFTDPLDDPQPHPLGFFRGILPNPHPGQTFDQVHYNVSRYCQFVPVWGKPSPFYNMSADLNGAWGDIFVEDLIRGNGMFPLVHMSFFGEGLSLAHPEDMEGATLSDQEWRDLYLDSALSIVNVTRPAYISIGNEVNRWYEQYGHSGENGFDNYLSLYNATYDAIKGLSPDTKVFCTFSREIVSENREADMSVLDLFSKDRMDLLVMTTYPFSVAGINRVSDLADDYYSGVFDHMDTMPVGFSEMSWISHSSFGGEREQSNFIMNMTGRLTVEQGLDLELLGWSWLHDIGPTDTSGLKFNDGIEKSSLNIFKMNTEPTYDRFNRTIDLTEDFKTFVYDLNRTFSDPDPWDSLTYRIWNGTAYTNTTSTNEFMATIVDGTLILRSFENVSGSSMIRIKVEDTVGETNWTMMLVTVEEVNDPPSIVIDNIPLEFLEGETRFVSLSLFVRDAEDDIEELDFSVIGSTVLTVELRYFPEPMLYIYPPTNDWNGITSIMLRVNDTDGASSDIQIPVIVAPQQDAPILNLPTSIEFDEDSTYRSDTIGWWTDPDGDDLQVNITTDDPNSMTIELNGSFMEITPYQDINGFFTIRVNVSDGALFTEDIMEINIIQVNDPPRSNVPPLLELVEDTIEYFNMTELDLKDPENEEIFFIVEDPSEKINTISFPGNGTMKIRPSPDSFGQGSFLIDMRDASGGSTIVRFNYSIKPVNDPPYLRTPENWTLYMNRGETVWIDLTLDPYKFEDPDNKTYDLLLEEDSDWCQVDRSDLVINVPRNTTLNGTMVNLQLFDPLGAGSEVRTLKIVVLDPLVEDEYGLEIDNISVSVNDGEIIVDVKGGPGQIIWAVISTSTSGKFSTLVSEDPNTPGRYYVRISGLGLQDGESCSLHLSSVMDGNNDAYPSPIRFNYQAENEDDGGDEDEGPDTVMILIIASVVILILFIFLLSRRKKLDTDPEE